MGCEKPSVFFYTYFYQFFAVFEYTLMESFSKFNLEHLYQCMTLVLRMLMCSSTYSSSTNSTYFSTFLWKISNSTKKPYHQCVLSGVLRIGINSSTAVCLNEDLLEELQLPTRAASCKQTLTYHMVSIHVVAHLPFLFLSDQNCIRFSLFKLYCS